MLPTMEATELLPLSVLAKSCVCITWHFFLIFLKVFTFHTANRGRIGFPHLWWISFPHHPLSAEYLASSPHLWWISFPHHPPTRQRYSGFPHLWWISFPHHPLSAEYLASSPHLWWISFPHYPP